MTVTGGGGQPRGLGIQGITEKYAALSKMSSSSPANHIEHKAGDVLQPALELAPENNIYKQNSGPVHINLEALRQSGRQAWSAFNSPVPTPIPHAEVDEGNIFNYPLIREVSADSDKSSSSVSSSKSKTAYVRVRSRTIIHSHSVPGSRSASPSRLNARVSGINLFKRF
jgi:hypothetical protein